MKLFIRLAVLLWVKVVAQDLHTVTIWGRNDFKVLRPCVQHCLYANGDVAPGAGCISPFYNQCWCSSNIAVSATRWISSCIPQGCSDKIDIATAVDIYYDYCSGAGFPIANTVAKPVASSVDLHTVTIWGRNDFKVLRPCVQHCLYANGDVAPGAGCVSPFYNQCWCSSNIAVSAASWISSCIPDGCSDNLDVATAVAIYDDYCSSAGFPIAAAAPRSTSAQTTPSSPPSSEDTTLIIRSSSGQIFSPSPIPTFTFLSTRPTSNTGNPIATASNPSETSRDGPNSEGWNPSTGEIVGLVFAIAAVLAGLIVLWFFLKRRSVRNYPPLPAQITPVVPVNITGPGLPGTQAPPQGLAPSMTTTAPGLSSTGPLPVPTPPVLPGRPTGASPVSTAAPPPPYVSPKTRMNRIEPADGDDVQPFSDYHRRERS